MNTNRLAIFSVLITAFTACLDSASASDTRQIAPLDPGVGLIPEAQCQRMEGSPGLKVCRYPGAPRTNVLIYYFHSILAKPTEWATYAAPFYESLKARGIPYPEVLSVSFGREWFLSENAGSKSQGRFEFLVEKAIPELETKLGLDGEIDRRFAVGASMGGFNVAQLYLRRPELWDAVVMACPALSALNPHTTRKEIAAYIRRTGARKNWIAFALWRSRHHFKTPEAWEAASPLADAQVLIGSHLPRVFLYGADSDRFGFQEGAGIFARMLKNSGVEVEHSIRPGDHCPSHSADIARFLYQIEDERPETDSNLSE